MVLAILMLVGLGPAITMTEAQAPRIRNSNAVITYQDYPDVALRRSEYGIVSLSLDIAADGKVDGCEITETSGSRLLDQRTCSLFRARAKFDPATDENHSPISAKYSTAVAWGSDTRFPTIRIDFDLKVSRIPPGYQFPVQTKVIFDGNGHADKCEIVQSSGSAMADQIACRQIAQRVAIPSPKNFTSVPPAAVRTVMVSLLLQSPTP